MTIEGVRKAVAAARRFILEAEQAMKGHGIESGRLPGSAASGAARRASMELTRELARMRRGK